MELTELYQKGKKLLYDKPHGKILDGVETEFDIPHDRAVLNQYTFRLRCIDAVEASTDCQVLGINLKTPVIMSAITNPIQAIRKNGLIEMALGLKEAGSLMWLGSQVPQNLKEIIETGVPLAGNVRPFKDRKKMFETIDQLQEAGVQWLGIQVDTGLGTKLIDSIVVKDCSPLTFKELEEIRNRVSIPLIFKGVLSSADAAKSIDAGADAIVVSHGAHILDYLPHPLQVMDEISSAVKGRLNIIVDSSFRRGSDVVKGLAFGAALVGICRPLLYGLYIFRPGRSSFPVCRCSALKQPVIRSTESKNTTSSFPPSVADYWGGRAHKATEDTILRSFSLQILGLPSVAREQSEKMPSSA